MPRAKKTTKAVDAKNILSELTPEEKASFLSGLEARPEWDDDDDDYSEDYEPVPTYANGFDPSKMAVNPITGTSKPLPPATMSNFLPGMGPTMSSTPPEEITKAYPETKKNYNNNLSLNICLNVNADLIKIADLMAQLKKVADSSNLVDALVMDLSSSYYRDNDGYEPIAK